MISLTLRQRVKRGIKVCCRCRCSLLLVLQICSSRLQLGLVHVSVALLPHQVLILAPILLLKPIVVLIEGVVWRWRCCTLQRPVQQASSRNPTSKGCSSVFVLSRRMFHRREIYQRVLFSVLLLQIWHRFVGDWSLAVPTWSWSMGNRHLRWLLCLLPRW